MSKEATKVKRCKWAQNVCDLYRDYHDNQWGIPVYDDPTLFEMLLLESFHTGLSWLLILRKRENFRKAFDEFDPEKIALYGEEKIEELMGNEKIVRNRKKIEGAIANAKAVLKIKKEFGSFSQYIWGFTNHKIIKHTGGEVPTKTPLSDSIAKDMKQSGMKFLGSITVYSYLQAVGIVNDHEKECFCYIDMEEKN